MDKKEVVMVFDKGQFIGEVIIEFNHESGSLMAIYEVEFPDNKLLNILYLADMNYGVVISKKHADIMREVCD